MQPENSTENCISRISCCYNSGNQGSWIYTEHGSNYSIYAKSWDTDTANHVVLSHCSRCAKFLAFIYPSTTQRIWVHTEASAAIFLGRICPIVSKVAKICRKFPKGTTRCKSYTQLPKKCQNMPWIARRCQVMPQVGKSCQNMSKVAKRCQNCGYSLQRPLNVKVETQFVMK